MDSQIVTILSLMSGVTVLLLVISVPSAVIPLVMWLYRFRARFFQDALTQLHDDDGHPGSYVVMEVMLGVGIFLFVFMVFKIPFLAILGAPFGALMPTVMIKKRVTQRFEAFEQQLPDALIAIASSVRAGLSLPQAIREASGDLPVPAREEFGLINKEYEAGLPLDDALRSARQRIGSRHFNLVVSALVINRERGGNISNILERIADSLRELFRLEEKIRTETSSARFEGRVMLAMPPLILFMLFLAEPDLVNSMFASVVGIFIVLVALSFMVVAWFWIQRILSEEP